MRRDVKKYINNSKVVHLDKEYSEWITELVHRYHKAQIKAAVKVNAEKLLWNWQMGRDLVIRKAESRWGEGIVEQVAKDLQAAFPDEKGFSTSNIWYMKKWYLFFTTKIPNRDYKEFLHQVGGDTVQALNRINENLHQLGGEIGDSQNTGR